MMKLGMTGQAWNPSTQGGCGRKIGSRWRLAWATQCIPVQPGLPRPNLKKKMKKRGEGRKKEGNKEGKGRKGRKKEGVRRWE